MYVVDIPTVMGISTSTFDFSFLLDALCIYNSITYIVSDFTMKSVISSRYCAKLKWLSFVPKDALN